jgi:oligopeptide/dipeptide ABC transporter ATP-binding protein
VTGGDPRAPLLALEHLHVWFPVKRGVLLDRTVGHVRAVDDVSLTVAEGEAVGVVGESGCGKTTLARAVVRLLEPTAGAIRFRGVDVAHAGRKGLAPLRREVQMVFQDPLASLNPRKRVGEIVGAPLRLHAGRGVDVDRPVRELLGRVGLGAEHVHRFPHELAGGQRQRVGIARALAAAPRLVLLDEPVSALDVSIRAQIVNLLAELQRELGLAYLFIAHDLSIVRQIADRIAVMHLGKLVELAPTEALHAGPRHPYTAALLAAVPLPDPRAARARPRPVPAGEPPSPLDPPSGCRFRTRCPRATDRCARVEPRLTAYPDGRLAACHHPLNVGAAELAAATRSPWSPRSAGDDAPRPLPVADGTATLREPTG